jgi:hypothetical protein
VVELVDPGPDRLFSEIGEGRWDAVVCSIGNGASYGTNVIRLHGVVARNMMQGWMRLARRWCSSAISTRMCTRIRSGYGHGDQHLPARSTLVKVIELLFVKTAR